MKNIYYSIYILISIILFINITNARVINNSASAHRISSMEIPKLFKRAGTTSTKPYKAPPNTTKIPPTRTTTATSTATNTNNNHQPSYYYAFNIKGTAYSKAYLSSGSYLLKSGNDIEIPLATNGSELYIQIFLNDKQDPYYTWLAESINQPSLWYLSTGEFGATGELSDYCLSLRDSYLYPYPDGNGNTVDYNRLGIAKCSSTKYKFKYENNKIYVFHQNGTNYQINGKNMCLHYDGNPFVYDCDSTNDSQYMTWNQALLASYIPNAVYLKAFNIKGTAYSKAYLSSGSYLLKNGNELEIPHATTDDGSELYIQIFLNDKQEPYYTWLAEDSNKPSLWYLSTGEFGATGEASDYCLGLRNARLYPYPDGNGNTVDYNRLGIVECSSAQYKFKFENNKVYVYNQNGTNYQINGKNMCLHYDGNPFVYDCNTTNDAQYMVWDEILLESGLLGY